MALKNIRNECLKDPPMYVSAFTGTESFDKIFTPEKLSRGGSANSLGLSPSANTTGVSRNSCLESTVASLEEVLLDSKANCVSLTTELSSSESSAEHISKVKQLNEKLESMKNLLNQLRNQL